MEEQFFSYVQAGNIEAVRTMIAMCPGLVSAMNEDTDNAYMYSFTPINTVADYTLLQVTETPKCSNFCWNSLTNLMFMVVRAERHFIVLPMKVTLIVLDFY